MPKSEPVRDLIILGGGAGGLVVASVAAQLGLRVSLIEQHDKLGGDCLHYGCVPSKTLLHSARVASLMRHAARYGLPAVSPQVDIRAINARIRSVIEQIQQHDDPQRFRDYGCEVLFGHARFTDAHHVEVNGQTLRAKRFVIATGSRPAVPPIDGLQQAGYLTHLDMFSLPALPTSMIVLGGGPIGVEMAQAYQRLGTQVTLLEQAPRLVPQEDAEAGAVLQQCLRDDGVVIHTSTSARSVSRSQHVYSVVGDNGERLRAEALLVATGRRANIDDLGLQAAGVASGQQGLIVDRRMRTSQKHIYACGDVCGPYAFTHMAEYQAGIVLSNAVFRWPKKADYRIVPRVIYSDPELAQVGLTAQQASDQGLRVETLRFEFNDIDRALTDHAHAGFCKLIVRKSKILGASIIGAHAGELVHEIALAMKTGAGIGDISATIHAYPTLSQIHRRSVNTAYAPKLFSSRSRQFVKWINRLLP